MGAAGDCARRKKGGVAGGAPKPKPGAGKFKKKR